MAVTVEMGSRVDGYSFYFSHFSNSPVSFKLFSNFKKLVSKSIAKINLT